MYDTIGKRIREKRERLGITQEMLSEKSKVSRATISALENGKSEDVLIGTLSAIATALDTQVESLFG